eukprot:Gb_07815 [translate_table: standard]
MVGQRGIAIEVVKTMEAMSNSNSDCPKRQVAASERIGGQEGRGSYHRNPKQLVTELCQMSQLFELLQRNEEVSKMYKRKGKRKTKGSTISNTRLLNRRLRPELVYTLVGYFDSFHRIL